MLWVILWILAVIGFTVHAFFDNWSDWGDVIMTFFGSLLSGFGILMIVLIISSAVCDATCDKTWYTYEDTKIYALQDNVSEEGRFFLGSGQVKGKLKYFYVEETDVGYTIRDVVSDNTYIQYTDGECHMEKQSYEFNHWFAKLIAVPLSSRQIFYIPEGSIVQNYTIDLE